MSNVYTTRALKFTSELPEIDWEDTSRIQEYYDTLVIPVYLEKSKSLNKFEFNFRWKDYRKYSKMDREMDLVFIRANNGNIIDNVILNSPAGDYIYIAEPIIKEGIHISDYLATLNNVVQPPSAEDVFNVYVEDNRVIAESSDDLRPFTNEEGNIIQGIDSNIPHGDGILTRKMSVFEQLYQYNLILKK